MALSDEEIGRRNTFLFSDDKQYTITLRRDRRLTVASFTSQHLPKMFARKILVRFESIMPELGAPSEGRSWNPNITKAKERQNTSSEP